ncbi:MAG: sulfotransferase [Cyanobacteria bacterium J06627_28]
MVNQLPKDAMVNRGYSPDIFCEEGLADVEMIQRPVFLVGAERSGTTLLRLMLNHHPKITFRAEFEYGIYGIDNKGRFLDLADYYRWLQTDRNFLIDRPRIDRRLNYPQLVNSFLKQFQGFSNKPIVGATVHHHFDRLLDIWPDASFIHIVRDGRDVSRSCMKMGWAGDGWHGAERWVRAETLWDKLKLQVPEHRRMEVRFESLIEDTINTLDGICQFMGANAAAPTEVRYHPDMMNYANGPDYNLPDGRLVNQWHHKLSKREIQLIEARIAPLLVDRGYALSGLPHLRVSRLGRLTLKVQNKFGILSRRAQKYGLPLTSADFIARKLKLGRLSDRIRKKINVIDINTMKQSW